MAAQYIEITLEEMEKFLKRGFRALRPKQGQQRGEIYFDLHLGQFVGIRVWSSIRPHSGTGAEVGADAIRVQLISLKDQGPLEKGKAPIVKRTQGWRNGLQDRIEELAEKYEDNDEFWEHWAETRYHGDPEREMKKEEQEEKRKELVEKQQRREEELGISGEGEENKPSSQPLPPSYQRTVPLDKLQGDITPKQAGFIRALLKKVDHQEWKNLGFNKITGFDHIPNQDELMSLSKRKASELIEALIGYGRRFANEEDFLVE